ncbi:MAG: tRNA uridine(34) 5-carboxymethylaminomethyl modification radical SAM/GNAT enzyme Elp3 [bacterium]|nr:tRNA uridine(34) 5-carboxymethylaminomethyl modification radical SAM/GNAT enzyme Elp3 [bacterium]
MLKEKITRELLMSEIKTSADLESFKRSVSRKYKIPCLTNIELLKAYHKSLKNKTIKKSEFLKNLLKTRPVRSLSGIVNVSVLTKPYPCPGKCIFCPIEKGIPKSYVSGEPAVERAKKLNYDPYLQVKKRIEMLEIEGHPTDKIELRIVGGTWSYYQKNYQDWFIKRCFEACNLMSRDLISRKRSDLQNIQRLNEKAKHRIIGLSVETRPDFINPAEIKRLRELGVTMVEMGIQSIYDDVLKFNLRGHTVKETILATKLLKDTGFKVLYQMMPNLPRSSLVRDAMMFKEIFANPNFQPDMLKIYPCALLKQAPLYKLWQKGKYKPYTEKQLMHLIELIKKCVPSYVRIQRISRDIPSGSIVAGPAKISNLRQILLAKMKREDWQCQCIRCREVRENYDQKEKIYLFRRNYQASRGKEIFLSFENKGRTKLYSLLRLRIPSRYETGHHNAFPILENAAVIREIHTYGQLSPLGGRASLTSPQHKGLGKKLLRESEKITKKEFGLKKIAVISGVGARGYFRESGYSLKDTYMIKNM